jgi:hypothetical protein
LLVVGYWQLVAGYWLLVAGYWFFGTLLQTKCLNRILLADHTTCDQKPATSR